MFISCSRNSELPFGLQVPRWVSRVAFVWTDCSYSTRQKQDATQNHSIEFKASLLRWPVPHLFAFCWPKQVPWLVWTLGLEVYSGYQDTLQVEWQGHVVCSLPGDGDSGRRGLSRRSCQSAPCLCPRQGGRSARCHHRGLDIWSWFADMLSATKFTVPCPHFQYLNSLWELL